MTRRASRSRSKPASTWLLSRWLPPVVLFVLTLAIVSGLWAYRIRSTAISFEGLTTDLEFTTIDERPITEPLALTSLGFTGARFVDFPPDLMPAEHPSNDFDSAMQLGLAELTTGSITLARLTVPKGASVAVHDDGGKSLRLTIDDLHGREFKLEATVEGSLLVGTVTGQAVPVSVAAPKLVVATFGDAPGELNFAIQSTTERALAGNLAVGSVGFSRIETVGSGLAAQQVSGIKSGELILHDLGNRAVPLRSGSDLALTLRDGSLQNVGFSEDGIKLHLTGIASDIRGGSGSYASRLMPSALDWLMANQRLALIWGAVIYLFGTALTVSRWWREVRS